jgi:hypothetical protein
MMRKVTIELTDNSSLKILQDLEQKHLIRIVKDPDAIATGLNSYALPGESINEQDFKKWIEYTEDSPTINITEAKSRWAAQKKKLQNRIR